METIKVQYQLSNGCWMECMSDDQKEMFLKLCETNNTINNGKIVPRHLGNRDLTRDEVINSLVLGHVLRNDKSDWYSNCRIGHMPTTPKIQNPNKTEMVKCDCGHIVPKICVMSASTGTSCADCYDNMSD